MSVALFQSIALKIVKENLLLKDLCDSELTSSFHLEAFELFDFTIEIEYNISFFQKLSMMLLYV